MKLIWNKAMFDQLALLLLLTALSVCEQQCFQGIQKNESEMKLLIIAQILDKGAQKFARYLTLLCITKIVCNFILPMFPLTNLDHGNES